MKRTLNFGLIFLLLVSFSNCNRQTKPETENSTNRIRDNKIVGVGCDGCELMYVGMPKHD